MEGELKGKGLEHLRRGGALRSRKGLKIRFVRAPAASRWSGVGQYLEALMQLEAMLQELVAREAARPLPGNRFAFAGFSVPGWVCPNPEGSSPSHGHVNRPRPAKKGSGGWAGWICPDCSFLNEKGTDFCQNCERDEIEADRLKRAAQKRSEH
eukprot:symbB.v1.2.007880.t1/scaffold482.1/size381469/8